MKIAVFDLRGPFAHFRKYYTNTSSLSYPFPPRTVLMGIIAAILGWERDSYYEKLNPDNARFGVVIKVPVRSLFQTVNYIRTKEEDLNVMKKLGFMKGTQVPLELLLPGGGAPMLNYRIYFGHKEEKITEEVAKRLKQNKPYFPLYLGLTEFIAQAQLVYFGEPSKVISAGKEVMLHSILTVDFLKQPFLTNGITLNREKAPEAFSEGRNLLPPKSYIYETQGRPWKAILSVDAYSFALPSGEENVAFMEGELWFTMPTENKKPSIA
ncbi:MAG: type I-B CRISPR-associated protein Cas5 [Caldanaerobacter subterraneus]|nr:type I-B CRISPR-associated protein Cas5 [Caldanaerobacter subterraneus]